MNQKRLNLFFIVAIILVVSVSFVSASWFSDFFAKITGEATINDQCEGTSDKPTCSLSSDAPLTTLTFNNYVYTIELISVADTAATIKVTNAGVSTTKEINEGATKEIQGLNVTVKSADETNLKLSATLEISYISGTSGTTTCAAGDTCLNSDSPSTTITFSNYNYLVELISASDTTATIKVTNAGYSQTKEINEGTNKEIQGLNVTVKNADETNLKLSATLKLGFISGISGTITCETGYTCLSSDAPGTILEFDGKNYIIELVSATDTSATVRVNSETKELKELETISISGLYVNLKSADETNLKLSAILKFSLATLGGTKLECEVGYTCLSSDNPLTEVPFNNYIYQVELISATDTSATIKVTNAGYSQTKEINGGATKEVQGLNVTVKSADETNLKLSVTLKLSYISGVYGTITCESGYTCLSSDNSKTIVTFEDVNYEVELLSASDTSATIEVTRDADSVFGISQAKEINEGETKEISGLNVYLKNTDETNLKFSAVLKLSLATTSGGEEVACDNGCSLDGNCYPYNNRKPENYCAVGGIWLTQSADGATCDNNFECSSNICISGQCVEGTLIQKILNWFRNLFS